MPKGKNQMGFYLSSSSRDRNAVVAIQKKKELDCFAPLAMTAFVLQICNASKKCCRFTQQAH